MQTKTYQCLEPIRHNGKDYMPPGTIDLTDEEANLLVDCDAVVEIEGDADSNPPAGTPGGESTAAVQVTTLAAIGSELGEINSGNILIGELILDPSLMRGTPSGDSTAAADALAEQTDKDTNLDPLNNKDGGDATPTAYLAAAVEALTPGASAPGAEETLTPASADAVQDHADPAPAVVSTAGGDGQTILDPAATPLDGAATGGTASPVVAEAPVQDDQAPADPEPADQASSEAPKKTRKARAAE